MDVCALHSDGLRGLLLLGRRRVECGRHSLQSAASALSAAAAAAVTATCGNHQPPSPSQQRKAHARVSTGYILMQKRTRCTDTHRARRGDSGGTRHADTGSAVATRGVPWPHGHRRRERGGRARTDTRRAQGDVGVAILVGGEKAEAVEDFVS
ncbi:unnamed protein product [Lampetra planeri]